MVARWFAVALLLGACSSDPMIITDTDAAVVDGGRFADSGEADSGSEDGGDEDAARLDSGPADSGEEPTDAALLDAPEPIDGGNDAAQLDAGQDGGLDAGADGGPADSATDTGPADTGADAHMECDPPCRFGRQCCDGQCVNQQNDILNCGGCGVVCSRRQGCFGGTCQRPACFDTNDCGSEERCCGNDCCEDGEICCDPQGPISLGPQCVRPNDQGTCPQGCAPLCACASPDTPIETPNGPRPISELAVGDLVFSVHHSAVVAVPVAAIRQQPVVNHHVLRIELESGQVLEVSGAHPTADGRGLLDLEAGELLDGVRILSIEDVPYPHPQTYDILPGSDTGTYFAGGVLIGSTLAQ